MAWGIAQKIQEVDDLFRKCPNAGKVIRECHPEICLCSLNRGIPMKHYKKKTEGRAERLAVLNRHFEKSDIVFKAALDRFRRKNVATDDIIDALAAAVTGFLSRGNLTTLPEHPEKDEQGLPMEMVYYPIASSCDTPEPVASGCSHRGAQCPKPNAT